jgi:transcriptional regulator with XRE-family HTH domain
MRRIAAADFARQIGISRATLHRLESGDPGISLNTLTMALFVLGKLDRIADLAEPARDDVGLMLAGRDAPRRIRRKASPSRVVDVAADRSEGDSTIAGFEAW